MSKIHKPDTTEVDQLLIQAVVLLQRQSLLAEHLIRNGQPTLFEFEQAIAAGRQSIDHVLAVFNYCWALVDQLERYRKIASVVPKLSQKAPEFRAMEASLRPLTNVRNQFQHINNHIRNQNSGPLLGAVCWINGTAQFIASLPDIGSTRSVPGISIDTKTGLFTHQFCYVYNDDFFDLGAAIDGMRSFQQYIDKLVQITVEGVDFIQQKHFIAMRAEFKLSP